MLRILIGVISLTAMAYVTWILFKKRTKLKWNQVGKVSKIIIYPLKSGRYLHINEAECTPLGLKYRSDDNLIIRDRYFVIYEEITGEKISAKNYPKVLQITTTPICKNKVKFSYKSDSTITDIPITIPDSNSPLKIIKLWSDNIATYDCGDEIARWLSRILFNKEKGCRLAYWGDENKTRRSTSKNNKLLLKAFPKFKDDYTGAFSDLGSYMLLNTASLNDLNNKIKNTTFTVEHFRPNIVVECQEPFFEDKWDLIRIGGNAIFKNFKPCTRCTLTTIDPETGLRDPQREPIKTLKTYRQLTDPVERLLDKDSPVMGINLGCCQGGTIKINDPVYINDDKWTE